MKTTQKGSLNFFYGEDSDSLKKTVSFWESEFKKRQGDLNITKYYVKKDLSGEIVNAARSIPFLAEKRLILVFDFLENLSSISEKNLKKIKDFLNKGLPETTVLIFIERVKPDKRTSLFKFLSKNAQTKVFESPSKDGDYLKLIQETFTKEGISISPENINFLFQRIGKNILPLRQELKKLVLFAQDKKEINRSDIENLVTQNQESLIWAFLNLIGQKKYQEIFSYFKNEIEAGTEPKMLFFMIVRQFKLFIEAQADATKKSKAFTRMPPWSQKQLISTAKKFSREKLIYFYKKLLQIDLDSKIGKIAISSSDQRIFLLEMERFLLEWCLR